MNIDNFLEITGKTIKYDNTFKASETFVAFYEASNYLKEKGYVVGSMCRDEPIAAAIAVDYIGKWYNIPRENYSKIDALILSSDFREGDVRVVEFTV